MSAKHTPGPWRVAPAALYANGGINVDAVNTNQYVCHVAGAGPDARAHADAVLIAASPELLDALKDAYPHIADDALRQRIGALIAKTEGIPV